MIFFYLLISIFLCYLLIIWFYKKRYQTKTKSLPRSSSKIKNIFVELHNYSFFHSPESVQKKYQNYVGRELLLQKLKTILQNSETRSGAYLITGFRGMGKTSLVRKAISELKGNNYYTLGRHFRLFLFLMLFSVIHWQLVGLLGYTEWIPRILFTLDFLGLWYLIYHDQKRPNFIPYYRNKYQYPILAILNELFKSFVRVFDPEIDYYKRSKFKVFLQDLIIITIQFWISNMICNKLGITSYLVRLTILATVSLSYFLIVFINNHISIEKRADPEYNGWLVGRALKRIFVNAIKRLDFGNKVTVEISLSQDDLKEIDILKLLAKNIFMEYKSLRSRYFAPNRIVLPVIITVALVLVTSLIYYYKPFYRFINDFRYNSGMTHYFPSQGLFPVEDSKLVQTFFMTDEFIENGSSNSQAYINTVNQNLLWQDQAKGKLILSLENSKNRRLLIELYNMRIDKGEDGLQNGLLSNKEHNWICSMNMVEIPDFNKEWLAKLKLIKQLRVVSQLFFSLSHIRDNDYLKNNFYRLESILCDTIGEISPPYHLMSKDDSLYFSELFDGLDFMYGEYNLRSISINISKSFEYLQQLERYTKYKKLEYEKGTRFNSLLQHISSGTAELDSLEIFFSFLNNEVAEARKIDPIDNASLYRKIAVLTDYTILLYYRKFVRRDLIEYNLNPLISRDFAIVPYILDYLYILTLFVFLLILVILGNNSWRFGVINHRYILRRLRELNDNIAAEIVSERQQSMQSPMFRQTFNIFTQRSKRQAVAGVREIENELIDILKEMDRIPAISTRPEFIFIFDELDKIEAQYNVNIQDKEATEMYKNSQEEGYFSTESIRRRKETIARILGNLKLFFNTARAKFIFIAGREMYDAALADISDRDSFISSIFHEIIYVESFFKDPGNREGNGVIGLTERYLCQLLMPRGMCYSYDLKGYNQYLLDQYSKRDTSLWNLKILLNRMKWLKAYLPYGGFELSAKENPDRKNERYKVIYTLQQLITYLTYRGNGAPKKITKLLEAFVRPITKEKMENPDFIVFGRNTRNLYLYLNYTDQYRLGLTHLLFKPFLVSHGKHMKDFGDKMLIATSFLIDHLYKYHRVGFSWENLELTPEIIAINKSPELRKYIAQLINFLLGSHIQPILSGLHEFKFGIRIAMELSYVSTVSEIEAAAFNFTLDESLLLKRHYRKKLSSLEYGQDNGQEGQHYYSKGYLHNILGDLHFYDREYDEAILQYMDGIQYLIDQPKIEYSPQQFILVMKTLLKVGLTYEKMRDYDEAIMTMTKASNLILEMHHILSGHFGQSESSRIARINKRNHNRKVRKKIFEGLGMLYQPLVARLYLIEKGSPNGISQIDVDRSNLELIEICEGLENDQKFLIEAQYYNKIADLLYYKNGRLYGGDVASDVNKGKYFDGLEPDYESYDPFETPQNKEGLERQYPLPKDFQMPIAAVHMYRLGLRHFIRKASQWSSLDVPHLFDSDSWHGEMLRKPELKYILDFLKGHPLDHKYINKSRDLIFTLASSLTDLADAHICSISRTVELDKDGKRVSMLNWEMLNQMVSGLDDQGDKSYRLLERLSKILKDDPNEEVPLDNKINQTIFLLMLGGQAFLQARNFTKYTFQLQKILMFIKRIHDHPVGEDAPGDPYNRNLYIAKKNYEPLKRIFYECMLMVDRAYGHSRRQQVYEWEGYFGLEYSDEEDKRLMFGNSMALLPEARETIVIMAELYLYLPPDEINLCKALSVYSMANPNSIINNRYNRVFELYYKVNLNFRLFQAIEKEFGTSILDNLDHQPDPAQIDQLFGTFASARLNELLDLIGPNSEDIIIHLISDSIYCLIEIIRNFKTFGVNYVSNYSLLGYAHDHMGNWCSVYHYFNKLHDQSYPNYGLQKRCCRFADKLRERLLRLVEINNIDYLDIGYHYKMAIQSFYSVLEMHNGGLIYKRTMQEMYYLDDDYDDNLNHFCSAIERLRINTGTIRHKINELKQKVKETDLFEAEDPFEEVFRR